MDELLVGVSESAAETSFAGGHMDCCQLRLLQTRPALCAKVTLATQHAARLQNSFASTKEATGR